MSKSLYPHVPILQGRSQARVYGKSFDTRISSRPVRRSRLPPSLATAFNKLCRHR